MIKLDWNLKPNHRLFFQANRSDEDVAGEISSPVLGTIALPSAERSVDRTANAGILRHPACCAQPVPGDFRFGDQGPAREQPGARGPSSPS